MEQTNDASTKSTTLLDDGNSLWVHWVGDRPTLLIDTEKSHADAKSDVYVKKASLAAHGSIRSEAAMFGTALVGLILDPSVFYGSGVPLTPYIDGIRSRGTNPVRGEVCDVIEVSFLQARQTWYLWLSRQDHLPRSSRRSSGEADTRVTVEEWSNVTVRGEIAPKLLAWCPAAGLAPMEAAPPGGFASPERTRSARTLHCVRPAEASSSCRITAAESSGSTYGTRDRPNAARRSPVFSSCTRTTGIRARVILGFNCSDDKRIARAFLRENGVTFPSVLDSSEATTRLIRVDYGNKAGILPLNYIIDPQGRVVDGWFGQDQDADRVLAALKKAGLALAQ